MMTRTCMMTLLFALLTALVVLPSPVHMHAYAQTDPSASPSSDPSVETASPTTATTTSQLIGGTTISCDTLAESKAGTLLGKIVPCLVYTITQSTVTFTAQMVSWLQPLMYTFLLVVVALYGIRVQQHEPEIYKQGFLLLVKIAIIATILADLGNVQAFDGSGSQGKLIPAVYGIMTDSQAVVAGAITTTNLKCDISNYGDANTPAVWAMMDCVMGKLYGFTVSGADGKPSMLLMTSVAGLATGFLFGGAWGVAVFFGMVAVLFSMFMLVIRTVVAFLTGYLIICIMLILSPLFLPLAFLRGTAPFYESYTRTVMAAFLTPIIITAYTMFALIVYDQMLFADNSLLQKIFKVDMIKNAVQPPKKPCNREVTNNSTDVRLNAAATNDDKDKLFSLPNLQNLSFPTLSGGNDACGTIKLPVFKINQVTGLEDASEKQSLTEIFNELVELFILGYLINAGQTMLPGIVTQLVGRRSGTVGVTSIVDSQNKFGKAYASATSAATKAFEKTPGNTDGGYVSGGDYVSTLPRRLADAAKQSKDAYINTYNTLKK